MGVNLDSIPLEEGEILSHVILPDQNSAIQRDYHLRGHRDATRRRTEGATVCLTLQDQAGRVEHIECPVMDLSATGVGLVFDQEIEQGRSCQIAYQTASHRLVRLHATVKRCVQTGPGRFEIGLRFTHRLEADQLRIVRRRPGRDITIGARMRKLRLPESAGAVN